MTFKIVLLLPIMVSCAFTFKPAQVYEPEIITSSSQFTDLQTEANNMPIYTAPPHFDFKEYQRRSQLDPQKYRYIQQQKNDQFHANEQYHANYRDSRIDDQQFQPSEESSVRLQAPVGQNWKFVTENVRDYVTSLPTTMMEYQNTSPVKQQNLLEKKDDMKKTGSYDKITPTLVPTEDSSRKGRIYKKSLPPNRYQLDESTEIHPMRPLQERQDHGNLAPYIGYLNPDAKQYQLSALTSLLGKHPAVQLQGLNQLLGNQRPVYIKPIQENQQDPEGINNQGQRNTQNQQQNYPALNNNALENAIIAQTQAIHQSASASPNSISNLQAQLDATAKLHADKIIAQAEQKALEHVEAQHKAIAIAQAQAEKVALAQVQAQNEALERAHAKGEQERANADESKKKLERLTEERRRFQEQIRQQALQRKLRERQEASKKQPESLPVASVLHPDAAVVAQKTHSKISPAESQNQYYHQVPSYAATVEVPYKLQSIHSYSPQTLNAPKVPVKYTTSTESFMDVHAEGYNQYTKSEEADVISKYFVPPQVTAAQYKNAKGEQDLLYAAKYAFGYRIRDYQNGNDFGHEEAMDGTQTKGHYHVLLPDGRVQNVHYIADDEGFHAKVSYGNEIESSSESDDLV